MEAMVSVMRYAKKEGNKDSVECEISRCKVRVTVC